MFYRFKDRRLLAWLCGSALAVLGATPARAAGPVLSLAPSSGDETVGTLPYTISMSKVSRTMVTVQFTSSDLTALAGQDYGAASGTITFAPGVTSVTIGLTILDDALVEGDQTFRVSLSSPTGGATLGTSAATVTILDNDP